MNNVAYARFALAMTSVLMLAACQRGVRPDERSAQSHRHEAAAERRAAAEHAEQYDPQGEPRPARATGRDPGGVGVASDLYSDYNPTTWHLTEAERHSAHAKEHEKAAAFLEKFEDEACKPFTMGVRASCPFIGPITASENIPNGVRLKLAAVRKVRAIAEHMRCHLAFARARAYRVADCPLMLRGTSVAVTADGTGIELVSTDAEAVKELRRLSAAATIH